MITISKHTLYRGAAVVAGLSLALGGLPAPASAHWGQPDAADVTVTWGEERQQVDGFGGSFAFHKAGAIQRLGEPLTREMLDAIFDPDRGLGLDIARVMVGDGGIDEWGDNLYDGPSDTIMPESGELVWDQPDWEERKDEFDEYQVWLMRQAQEEYGVDTIMASVWSAPAWMKEDGTVTGEWADEGNRLDPDMYPEFADYLAEYVLGYKEHFGIDITHISPSNEPDFSGGYSSSMWTPEELNIFVRDHLAPTFAERDVPAKIVLGEGINFDEEYAAAALDDPETVEYVDVVAAHAYSGLQADGTEPDPEGWTRSRELGKTIWQTEYMNQGAPQDRIFENNTISDGLRYATLIGNMFDMVDLNAYFWWWPVGNSGADGSNLIRLMNDGWPQSGNPTETGEYRIFKRYYTIGQYSRFIEPGDVMLDTETRPAEDLLVTAYKDPDSDDYAVVAVNRSDESQSLTLDLDGFPSAHEPLVPYRTSASENQAKLSPVHAWHGEATVELRGESVTTLVPQSAALPELPDRKDVFSTYEPAESDGMSPGLQVRHDADRGKVLRNIRHGTHVAYENVNFADGSAAGFLDQKGELQMHAHVAPMAGGTIEVRLDSPDGPVVGEMDVPEGESPWDCWHPWKSCDSWTTVSTEIDTSQDGGAYGFHDMYLVFDHEPRFNNRMFHVDHFEFSD